MSLQGIIDKVNRLREAAAAALGQREQGTQTSARETADITGRPEGSPSSRIPLNTQAQQGVDNEAKRRRLLRGESEPQGPGGENLG